MVVGFSDRFEQIYQSSDEQGLDLILFSGHKTESMLAREKADQTIVTGALTKSELAILKARILAKKLMVPRALKIKDHTVKYNKIMSKIKEVADQKQLESAKLRKPEDPAPVIVNAGCSNSSIPCIHCRSSSTCSPTADKPCDYYPVQGENEVSIKALEKKRLWNGIRIPYEQQSVQKNEFWYLWSSRCECKANCPRWQIVKNSAQRVKDRIAVNLALCGHGDYEYYDTVNCAN